MHILHILVGVVHVYVWCNVIYYIVGLINHLSVINGWRIFFGLSWPLHTAIFELLHVSHWQLCCFLKKLSQYYNVVHLYLFSSFLLSCRVLKKCPKSCALPPATDQSAPPTCATASAAIARSRPTSLSQSPSPPPRVLRLTVVSALFLAVSLLRTFWLLLENTAIPMKSTKVQTLVKGHAIEVILFSLHCYTGTIWTLSMTVMA